MAAKTPVGAGTAGSALAGRLAEEYSWRVLLLEAGGAPSKKVHIPWFHIFLAGSPHDWRYYSEPNRHGALLGYEDQRAPFWRGRVLGGTASINTMLYMRGNRLDYDAWRDAGNEGWGYEDCLPYFRKLETMTNKELAKDTYYHGTDGPMVISDSRFTTKIRKSFLRAGTELGYDLVDPNTGEGQTGFAPYLYTIKDGMRWTPADAYLDGHKPNLHLAMKAHAHRVLFDEDTGRAVGVRVAHRGRVRDVFAAKEVILCAGAVESPKLLMLSGIGPEEELHKHNIYPRVHLPGVGRNLQDHIATFGMTWLVKAQNAAYNPFLYTADPRTFISWKLGRSGPLAATVGVEGVAFLPTSQGNHSWPDVQLTFVSTHAGYDGGSSYRRYLGLKEGLFRDYFRDVMFKQGFSVYPSLQRPRSRGYVTLRSASPYDHPVIQPNYLSDDADVEALVEGLKLALKVGNSAALRRHGARYMNAPLPTCAHHTVGSHEYWRCFVRHMATSDHHPAGTCKMGPYSDHYAVVDDRFRVRGVEGLRVVDASVMPALPTGNINIPVVMLAERAADFVKQEQYYAARPHERADHRDDDV